MQPYDIFMLVVLIGAGVFGAWKGMAWQLASIASVVVSSIVALRFSGVAAPFFSAQEPWNRFLAMAVLFAGTSLAVWIAFRFVAKAIDRVKLKEFDLQMGALFGLAKGVLFCLVLTFFAVTLSEMTRQRVLESRSGRYAAVIVQKGTPLMPDDVRKVLARYIEQLDAGLKTGTPPPAEPTDTVDTAAPTEPVFGAPVVGQAGPGQPMAWEPEAWRRDAQAVVTQRIDQFGRRLDQALNQSLDQVRGSVDQTTGQIQTDVNRQFDEFGRRIQRTPMEPVR
ncbi:MAG: CvpA family protein [Thermoguttaceae bacterium]|jgi:membrane protein required for colicin V production